METQNKVRRNLNNQETIKELGNAIEQLIFTKADEDKTKNYIKNLMK